MFEKLKTFFDGLFDRVEATMEKLGLELVAEWRAFWKTYSFWFFVILGGLPDFYDLVVTSGMLEVIQGDSLVPDVVTNTIKVIAFMGAASRFIKQKKIEAEIEQRAKK